MWLDALDIMDRNNDRKYNDMQARLEKVYEKITELEDAAAEFEDQMYSIRKDKINADNVYQYLILFSQSYKKMTDMKKKKFFQSFISEVRLYEEQQESGQILKSIRFKFPVFYNGAEVEEIRWDKNNTVETVVSLSKGEINSSVSAVLLRIYGYVRISE